MNENLQNTEYLQKIPTGKSMVFHGATGMSER